MNSKIELKILTVEVNPSTYVHHLSTSINYFLCMGVVYNEIIGSTSVEFYTIMIPSTEMIHNFDLI